MNGENIDSQLKFYNLKGLEKIIELETFVNSINIDDN